MMMVRQNKTRLTYKSPGKHFIFDQSPIKLHFSIKVPRCSNNVTATNIIMTSSSSASNGIWNEAKIFLIPHRKKKIIRKINELQMPTNRR